MKLKLDDQGHVVVQNGMPVYVNAEGKDVAVDVPGTADTITRLNGEAKSHRERAENAEKALKAFEGIADPAAALEAMKTVANIKDKKLMETGEVDTLKAQINKAWEDKFNTEKSRGDTLEQQLQSEVIGGNFARSQFIKDKLILPSDIVQAQFGKAFGVEDGKLVAKGPDGNKILSKSRIGEPANFDEAIEYLVENYPNKASILKGTGAAGGGSNGGGGGDTGKNTMKREAFFAQPGPEQARFVKEGGIVVD